jgi:predicted DNA-binding protein (UPF0251 family)
MARPVKPRKLLIPHRKLSFIPEGDGIFKNESITLLSEEYEAVKLVDYENMNHLEAAKILHISRPTLTRIYERARKKISECLIEAKTLKISGGNSIYIENWFKCSSCNSVFNIPDKRKFENCCPVCGGKTISEFINKTD